MPKLRKKIVKQCNSIENKTISHERHLPCKDGRLASPSSAKRLVKMGVERQNPAPSVRENKIVLDLQRCPTLSVTWPMLSVIRLAKMSAQRRPVRLSVTPVINTLVFHN